MSRELENGMLRILKYASFLTLRQGKGGAKKKTPGDRLSQQFCDFVNRRNDEGLQTTEAQSKRSSIPKA